MLLKLARRMLVETDKRLLWKLAWNMGWKGMLSVQAHKRRLRRGERNGGQRVGRDRTRAAQVDRVGDLEANVLGEVELLGEIQVTETAENVAAWCWSRLAGKLPGLHEVRIWEIPSFSVAYRGPEGMR